MVILYIQTVPERYNDLKWSKKVMKLSKTFHNLDGIGTGRSRLRNKNAISTVNNAYHSKANYHQYPKFPILATPLYSVF